MVLNVFRPPFSVPVVDRLQVHWEDSHTRLLDRMKQLHNMQQDSINWLDARKRVDLHISRASDRLESWLEITYTVEELKKQNAELKVGFELLASWMHRISAGLNWWLISFISSETMTTYLLIALISSPSGLFERAAAVAGSGGWNQCLCWQTAKLVC